MERRCELPPVGRVSAGWLAMVLFSHGARAGAFPLHSQWCSLIFVCDFQIAPSWTDLLFFKYLYNITFKGSCGFHKIKPFYQGDVKGLISM